MSGQDVNELIGRLGVKGFVEPGDMARYYTTTKKCIAVYAEETTREYTYWYRVKELCDSDGNVVAISTINYDGSTYTETTRDLGRVDWDVPSGNYPLFSVSVGPSTTKVDLSQLFTKMYPSEPQTITKTDGMVITLGDPLPKGDMDDDGVVGQSQDNQFKEVVDSIKLVDANQVNTSKMSKSEDGSLRDSNGNLYVPVADVKPASDKFTIVTGRDKVGGMKVAKDFLYSDEALKPTIEYMAVPKRAAIEYGAAVTIYRYKYTANGETFLLTASDAKALYQQGKINLDYKSLVALNLVGK